MDKGRVGPTLAPQRMICIGGAAIDRKYRAVAPVEQGTSNPVASERSFGGVARNVAENIVRLGEHCSLMSVIGDDENGRAILDNLAALGVDTRLVTASPAHRTAEYVAVLEPHGELFAGLADMAILDAFAPTLLQPLWPYLSQSTWVFADCNLPAETLHLLIAWRRQKPFALAVDGVSTSKVKRLPQDLSGVDLLFLNADEGKALVGPSSASSLDPSRMAAILAERGAARVVMTLGARGLIASDGSELTAISPPKAEVIDATGAGDALIAATLVGLMNDVPFGQALQLGTTAAHLTIECPRSVRPDLSLGLLEALKPNIPHDH